MTHNNVNEPVQWRCFHCDEVFTIREQAALHFGTSERQNPACQIDIAEYRAMEARMVRYNEEDADIHRRMARMQSEHASALRRAEEAGYAKALKDVGYSESTPTFDRTIETPRRRQAVEKLLELGWTYHHARGWVSPNDKTEVIAPNAIELAAGLELDAIAVVLGAPPRDGAKPDSDYRPIVINAYNELKRVRQNGARAITVDKAPAALRTIAQYVGAWTNEDVRSHLLEIASTLDNKPEQAAGDEIGIIVKPHIPESARCGDSFRPEVQWSGPMPPIGTKLYTAKPKPEQAVGDGAVDVDAERIAFEAQIRSGIFSENAAAHHLRRNKHGVYEVENVEYQWDGWLLRANATPRPAVATPDEVTDDAFHSAIARPRAIPS
ncbi:hypothetical protein PLUTO_00680 [Luteibacter phage vB_LflM-Pluto]|uniref:Uncharacterized protein n=1 Tax=Luteibacter phage vB_LflM-Pluto TaxID=2948611 RepID=A0A9E7MUM2_9CAUD|nr:hypothetical protein PLUTO_00680 [Luteibacter phage vB_LflM-Pluto]